MFDLYYTTFAIANWEAGIPRNAVHQHNSLSKASGAHSVAVAVPFVPPRQSGAHTVSLSTYLLFEPSHNTSLEPYAPLCNDSTKRTSNNDTAKSSHPVYTGAPIHFTFFRIFSAYPRTTFRQTQQSLNWIAPSQHECINQPIQYIVERHPL